MEDMFDFYVRLLCWMSPSCIGLNVFLLIRSYYKLHYWIMNMSGVFILCQIWIVIIICVMAVDWKNLIQIQVSEENGYTVVAINQPWK